jgi:predicted transcriptional regulator
VSARRAGGGLEHEVLGVLAAADESLTSAQVLAALGRPLAYMTVMTTLTRLHAKGAVTRERAGRAYIYRWCDQATVTARQMRRLLDRDEDRAQVLAKFVSELAPEDGQLLEALLSEAQDDGA